MKKFLISACLLAAVGGFAVGMSSCGKVEPAIEVLVPAPDHGWTGAVTTYAQEEVARLNKEGKYKFNLTTCESPDFQNNKISDLLETKEAVKGIVMLPLNNTVESGVTKIAKAEVPFVQFDRVINSDEIDNSKGRVSHVMGDNEGIGRETAKAFLAHGLQKTDKILIMPGDLSTVPGKRTNGFKEILKSQGGWTDAEIKSQIDETDATNWNRTTARTLFANKGDALLDYKWIFTHDSEIAMGILEELKANNVSEAVKNHFKTNVKAIASSSGLDEMYAVLENKHTGDYGTVYGNAYVFDVTYDPAMIKIAINDMVKHLDGETVEKTHIVKVNVVDSTNVTKFQGFARSEDYRKK